MRKWNKPVAALLAAVMALSLTGVAFADETAASTKPEYTDVPAWAEEYVERMTEKELIDGKTETTFGADDPMTRADLVVALYRLAGSPDVKDVENPFADVKDDAACKDAVVWAFDQKIVNGKSSDTFDPEGSAQRQEIAKIVNEFAARQVGRDSLTNRLDEMSGFPDAADVSAWAKDYMNWAVASGFISGSDGYLLPAGTATRAEVSAIICRYMDDAGTGDASKDDPRNQAPTKDTELLVVSFGTSFNDNRVVTIKAIEDDMAAAFPDYDVRRGFTANIIIEHIYRRDGEQIDDVKEALDRAARAGVKDLVVQPTHLMNGYEYGDLRNMLEKKYADKFDSIKIGAPLLTSDDDFEKVADAMLAATASFDDGKTAICFMGHGTEAASNVIYNKMQKLLQEDGHENYFIGTVDETETAATLDDVVKAVKDGGYERVVLRPMMIVAGDHANNDMAGDDEDSWKNTFIANGFEAENVICEVKGLGEIKAVRDLLVAHAKAAVNLEDTDITSEPNPENPDNEMEPEPSRDLADGTYTIDVESDSSMFRVVACELTVKDGRMTAKLTLSGTGYDQMYVGTKSEAANAKEGFVDYEEDADGKYTFTIPVAALDEELSYAAHGTKSGNWFDRTLTFDAASTVAK